MAFNIPNQTTLALQRPTNPVPAWTRQPDWPVITDNPDEAQFLVCDLYPTYRLAVQFQRTTPGANLYVDWGDGTTDTLTTDNTYSYFNHTYTVGTGTACSLGYTTFKIRVYTDTGATIDLANLNDTPSNAPVGQLEVVYGDNVGQSTGISLSFSRGGGQTMLQYVKMPATYLSNSWNNGFANCYVLAKIVMPTSLPNIEDMSATFTNCYALQSIIIPELPKCTSFFQTFNTCYSLNSITLPNTLPLVTSLNSTFSNCTSLTRIELPSLPACINYTSTFNNCTNLLQLKFNQWVTTPNSTITFSSTFTACRSLANIIFPNTAASGIIFSGFTLTNLTSLVSVVLPEYWNTTSLSGYFSGCTNLQSVVLPTTMSGVTAISTTFQNCYSLQNVTLPYISGSTIGMGNCFDSCQSLSKVVIPQTYNISSWSSTFANCWNLTSVTLPTGSQDSCTTYASMFANCYNLQSVVMPSSMNGITNPGAAPFASCYNLKSIVMPTSMTSITGLTIATNCYDLISVTLPTSLPACTTFAQCFQNCYSLRGNTTTDTLTLPATVSATLTTYNTAFQNCYNLKNVVLPTTQTTSCSNITIMFQNCYSLKSVTNIDKIGNTSTTGTIVNGTTFTTGGGNITGSVSLSPRLSKLEMQGVSTTNMANLTGLRLTNTGSGQWGGTSPQINVSYTSMSTAALNTLFADIAAQGTVTSKTINITDCTGAAGLSAGDRLVITSKGWTITG